MARKLTSFFLENTSLRQTVFKNTFWLSVSQIISRLIRAGIIIYAARVLGALEYGAFSYALSLAGLFALFADIGLSSLLTREAAKQQTPPQGFLFASLILKLFLVGVSMMLIAFVAPTFTRIAEAAALLPIAALILGFDSLRDFFFSLARARQKMHTESLVTITTNIAIAAISFIGLLSNPTSKALVVAYAAGSAIGLCIALFIIGREFFKAHRDSLPLIRGLLVQAWPFALLGILSTVMVNMDTLMLGWFRGSAEVGLYGAAQRPILLLYALPALFATSLFPLFARYAHTHKEMFQKILETSLAGSIAVVLPVVVGGFIVGDQIISLLYGEAYGQAAVAFKILLFTLPIVFPAFIIGDAIVSYNGQKTFFMYSTIGAVGDIILNALLIPRFGIAGAALSTVAAQVLTNVIVWNKLRSFNQFSVVSRLPRLLLATVGMGIFTYAFYWLGLPVVVTILLSAFVYGGLLILMKEPLLREVKKIFTV